MTSLNDSKKAGGDSWKVKELSWSFLHERCLSVAVVDASCSSLGFQKWRSQRRSELNVGVIEALA